MDKSQLSRRPDCKPRVVPVAELARRGDNRGNFGPGYAAHPLQSIDHFFPLDRKLLIVVHVLPLAAGAFSVVGARGRDPGRRGFQNLQDLRGGVPATDAHHLGNYPLAGDAAQDEYVLVIELSHCLALSSPGIEGEGKLLSFLHSYSGQLSTSRVL